MESFMKRAILLAACAVTCLSLSACVTVPTPSPGEVIQPAPDAKAIKFEGAVATLADSLAIVAFDPAINRQKLADQVVAAVRVLDRGRAAYDARQGSAADLAREAMDLIAAVTPADVSPRTAQALLAARLALAVYANSVPMTGEDASPSAALVMARNRTDDAIQRLRAALPPPTS